MNTERPFGLGASRTTAYTRERQLFFANTIVAVVSDHGEGLWDHVSPPEGLNAKATPREYFFRPHGKVLYEEVIATPMILKGPGIPSGQRIDSPVENIDLFPTLLELCDLAPTDGLHGQSLVPAMHGEETGREHVFSSVDMFCSSVRSFGDTTEWKLIVPTEHFPKRKVELFDIRTDPSELKNLAGARPRQSVCSNARIHQCFLF